MAVHIGSPGARPGAPASAAARSPRSPRVAAAASATSGAALAGPGFNQLELVQAQGGDSAGPVRRRLSSEMDVLVRGMKTLTQRISDTRADSARRAVLMSRFNDLERQLNEIDGIVGGEGREAQARRGLVRARVAGMQAAGTDRADRRTMERERQASEAARRTARRVGAEQPANRAEATRPPARSAVRQMRAPQQATAIPAAVTGTLLDVKA